MASSTGSLPWKTPLHLSLIALVFILACFRFFVTDAHDRYKCKALLRHGSWLDNRPNANWQPDGCILHNYQPAEASSCLSGRHVLFVGDSVVRQVYYATVRAVDPAVPTDADKHSDRSIIAKGIHFDFLWSPYLNTSSATNVLSGQYRGKDNDLAPQVPALLVLGSGLWYLRQYPAEQALSLWAPNMDRVFAAVQPERPLIADEVVLLPVEPAVEHLLTPERAAAIHNADVDRMNADLAARALPDVGSTPLSISIPWVFNKIIENEDSETLDGLHYSDRISKVQANILYNLRCNDAMPKRFPLDKTCCSLYPTPNYAQFALLAFILIWSPIAMQSYATGKAFPYLF